MQYLSFSLILSALLLASPSHALAEIDRSPAIDGPATEEPVGDQARMYEGLSQSRYLPEEEEASFDLDLGSESSSVESEESSSQNL